MKRNEKTTARTIAALLACLIALSAAGCKDSKSGSSSTASSAAEAPLTSGTGSGATIEKTGLWAEAAFTEDQWVGEGTLTVIIETEIDGKSITFTVKSDKDNLAEILTENGIAEGEESAYGLYIKKVNGVRADYDLDKAYWALNKDGEATPVGASDITVKDGEHYELVYTPA